MRDDGNAAPATAGPFERLNRELAASAEAGSFESVLSVTPSARGVSQRCPECCHWSLPLNPPYIGRDTPCAVPLTFSEWLVYHIHIQLHQRLHEREVLVS